MTSKEIKQLSQNSRSYGQHGNQIFITKQPVLWPTGKPTNADTLPFYQPSKNAKAGWQNQQPSTKAACVSNSFHHRQSRPHMQQGTYAVSTKNTRAERPVKWSPNRRAAMSNWAILFNSTHLAECWRAPQRDLRLIILPLRLHYWSAPRRSWLKASYSGHAFILRRIECQNWDANSTNYITQFFTSHHDIRPPRPKLV